jgi:hypothetical protein
VPEGSVIRLFTFRAVRPAFDEILRGEIVPDLRVQPGILDCYSARQGPDEIGPRIVASIWQSRDAMVRSVGEVLGVGPFHPEYLAETTDQRLEILPLEIGQRFATGEPARILRILRGTVRTGEFGAYADDVRDGVRLDAERPNGPASLYLAPAGADDFITLSAWRRWSDIELATGGDVHRPRATRHPERLIDWDVSHFEIVLGS